MLSSGQYFFLPGIIALGIITSYEDIKYGKIRNKWIIAGLIYFLVVFSGLLIYNVYIAETSGVGGINWQYVLETFINAGIALLLGYALWHFGIWTAGDGKLFFAFAVMMPVSAYSYGYIQYFPSLSLLINIFIPLFIVMLVLVLLKTTSKQKQDILKKTFEIKQLFFWVISLFAILWIVQLVLAILSIKSVVLSLLLSFFVFFIVQRAFDNKAIYFMGAIAVLRLFFDKTVFTFVFLKSFLFIVLLWVIIIVAISEAGFITFTKEVKIKELRQGMILAENIYLDRYKKKWNKDNKKFLNSKKKYSKERATLKDIIADASKKYFFDSKPEGLTKNDIAKIRKLYKQKQLTFNSIRIKETIPFAPLIFVGVAITLLAKGNIFHTLLP